MPQKTGGKNMSDRQNKRRGRAKKWVEAYEKWQESGLTQRSYCSQWGLIFTQFKAGIENARQQGLLERPSQDGKGVDEVTRSKVVGFAPVQINNPERSMPYCEIRFEGKAGIRIETAESLRYFVDLLNGRCSK